MLTTYADKGYPIICHECEPDVEGELWRKKKLGMEDFLKNKIVEDKSRLVELCEENNIPKYIGKIGPLYRNWNDGSEPSAYVRFYKTQQEVMKEANPEMSNGKITIFLTKAWKEMDEEGKNNWRSEEEQKHWEFLKYYESTAELKNKLKEYVEELHDLATDDGILYEVMLWPYMSVNDLFEALCRGRWIEDNWDDWDDN